MISLARKQHIISKAEKAALVIAQVRLNGVRAKITGRLQSFPHVSQLDPPYQSVEYSWYAVARVVENGGEFSTM